MAKNQDKAADKAAKKEQRAARRARGKENRSQLWQAFNLQRKQDKWLIPIMLGVILGTALVFWLISLLWGGSWWMVILGLLVGVTLSVWVFTKRLENSMYDKVDGQTGAVGWTLQNMKNSVGIAWVTETGVATNHQMDVVHRTVGNPGIILTGEGDPKRLKPLMDSQAKRMDRVMPGVPVYRVVVGNDESAGQTPLKKLSRSLLKLPRNYKKDDVYAMVNKLEAIDKARGGQMRNLPKGPIPHQAQNMSGMNRRMRRAQERKGK